MAPFGFHSSETPQACCSSDIPPFFPLVIRVSSFTHYFGGFEQQKDLAVLDLWRGLSWYNAGCANLRRLELKCLEVTLRPEAVAIIICGKNGHGNRRMPRNLRARQPGIPRYEEPFSDKVAGVN